MDLQTASRTLLAIPEGITLAGLARSIFGPKPITLAEATKALLTAPKQAENGHGG